MSFRIDAIETVRARWTFRVRGAVQGVGFRPTVYRMARALSLAGFVRNDADGVWIEVEGAEADVRRFAATLRSEAPPLARIDSLEGMEVLMQGDRVFRVIESVASADIHAIVPADAATCDACLRELFDPTDRRHRYPFVNCTDCGPRYTIVRALPYDRANTTMQAFTLCGPCTREYEDPGNRRFHAEPNACATCGPRLELAQARRASAFHDDALRGAIALLEGKKILALKGLGGFQLAVDASSEGAVTRLRERKGRPDKPLAVMARDLAALEAQFVMSDAAREALVSPARPIVLVTPRAEAVVAPSVAPRLGEIGVMLPCTPLHHLLLAEGPPLLVMTSGNRSDEPIVKDNAEALSSLTEVADAVLLHDREIHARADDSVLRVVAGKAQPVRRSRGYVPERIALGWAAPSILAVGAELKNTICVTRDGDAHLSPHIGDLAHPDAFAFFEESIAKLTSFLGVRPLVVAHDLHPEYLSTRWALACGLPRMAVQHHHAHIASCLAEHQWTGPVIGVAFDGTGCGPQGDLWGGEILLADLGGFRRLGHLRPIALAGGEAAIRQPWRLALAALIDAEEPLDLLARIDPRKLESVRRLLQTDFASPRATGAGRWFDAVAALAAVRDEVTFEGQAAMELEAIAAPGAPYPFLVDAHTEPVFSIDLRPVVRAIAGEVRGGADPSVIAGRFHETLAAVVREGCRRAREEHGLDTVALSGGCFQNKLLTERALALLEGDGFEVLVHRTVPPNDGGIALGQAAVAAHRLRKTRRNTECA